MTRQEYRYLCDNSFWHFIRIICDGSIYKVKEKGLQPASPIIHKPLCDFWQDRSIPYKAIYMGRYWRKSTYFTALNAMWEYLRNPEIRILFASQKGELVGRFLLFIERQFLHNETLRWIYSDIIGKVDKKYAHAHPFSSETCLMPRNSEFFENTFHVIGITGGSQGGHFDIIYGDDLISEKGMESELIMEDACRWFDNIHELLDETDPKHPRASQIRIIGTHWKPGDLGEYIQEEYPNIQWRIVPVLKTSNLPEHRKQVVYLQNPNAAEKESNWPEAHPTEKYLDMLNNPAKRVVFWCQHMNIPTGASELTKFDTSWLKYFHWEERDDGKYIVTEEKESETFKLSHIPGYGIIDPGGFAETKMIKKGSNNAMLIGGQPRESIKKFVFYIYAGKIKKPSLFRNEFFNAHEKFKPRAWHIETFAQQKYIKKDLEEDKSKRGLKIAIYDCPKEARDVSNKAKDARMQALIPPMENGEIYVHASMKKLIAEIASYPGGLTCDLLDCLGWLNQLHWSRKKRVSVAEKHEQGMYQYLQSRSPITGY